MANNEHKNLSNANLHVPKDFSTASNSTTLTKDSSGNLSWISNTDLGKQRYNIIGYFVFHFCKNHSCPLLNSSVNDVSPGELCVIKMSPTPSLKPALWHCIV